MHASTLTLLAACVAPLALATPACAQALNPTPAAGLWQTESKLSINGQDMATLMRQAMQEALKAMPASERAAAEEMMKSQLAAFGGTQKECVSAEDAARRTTARAVLDELQQDAPHCRFEPVQVSGGSLRFKGRCADSEGFTGDVSGDMTMASPKAWTARWTGNGTMAQADEMPGLKIGADGRVQMAWSGSGRWVAAQCPAP